MAIEKITTQDQGTNRVLVDFVWTSTAAGGENLDMKTLIDVSALDDGLNHGKNVDQLKILRVWANLHLVQNDTSFANTGRSNSQAVYLTDSLNNIILAFDRQASAGCLFDYSYDGQFFQTKGYGIGNEAPNGDLKIGIGHLLTKSTGDTGTGAQGCEQGSFVHLIIEAEIIRN